MPNFNTPEPYQIRRWLVMGAGILGAIAVIALLVNFLILRAVKTTPAEGKGGEVLQTITLEYNRSLHQNTKDRFTIDPKVEGTVTVEGKILRFVPNENFNIGTTYTITVKPVGSIGDPGLTTKFSFTPDRDVAKIALPQNLAASLPYGTTQYFISYTVNPENTLNIFVRLNARRGDPRLPQYKAAAVAYIKDHNQGTIDNLTIFFDPDPDIDDTNQSHEHEHTDGSIDGERGGGL
jgi:hypothetical protein